MLSLFRDITEMLPIAVAGMSTLLLTPLIVLYILRDIQGRKAQNRDAHLGAKVVLSFLSSLAFQLVLLGVAVFLASVFEGGHFSSYIRKVALGLVLGGAMGGALPLLLLFRVRQPGDTSGIERAALGLNGCVTGAIFTLAVTVMMIALFLESRITIPLAIVLTYVPATLGCILPMTSGQAKLRQAMDGM